MRVIDFFDRGVLLHPDRAFMIAEDGATTTHREAQDRSHRTALAMNAAGFDCAKHAAIYSPNHPGAFDALLGLYRAGGVWVPINARNAIAENAYILNNNDAEFLFYNSDFEDNIKVELNGVEDIYFKNNEFSKKTENKNIDYSKNSYMITKENLLKKIIKKMNFGSNKN